MIFALSLALLPLLVLLAIARWPVRGGNPFKNFSASGKQCSSTPQPSSQVPEAKPCLAREHSVGPLDCRTDYIADAKAGCRCTREDFQETSKTNAKGKP